jgi:hypothetical protein
MWVDEGRAIVSRRIDVSSASQPVDINDPVWLFILR